MLNGPVALGASILTGFLLCFLCLGKFLAPLIMVVGLFVGLPLFWAVCVSRITNEPVSQLLIMFAAFTFIVGVAQVF